MAYDLYYWPMIPGRGEYPRLVLEAAGVAIERLDQAARDGFREASAPAYNSDLLTQEQIAEWEAAKSK